MDAAKLNLRIAKSKRGSVSGRAGCLSIHPHINVERAGVSQELLTTATVVGWHNPAWGHMVLVTVRIWSVT